MISHPHDFKLAARVATDVLIRGDLKKRSSRVQKFGRSHWPKFSLFGGDTFSGKVDKERIPFGGSFAYVCVSF